MSYYLSDIRLDQFIERLNDTMGNDDFQRFQVDLVGYFKKLDEAYNSVYESHPRPAFLSFCYIIFQLIKRRGIAQSNYDFKIFRSKERIETHDREYAIICDYLNNKYPNDLKWEVFQV